MKKISFFFSPSRKLVPFIKEGKSFWFFFLQFTEAKLYSIYVPLLIYKIDSQNKYFIKSCVIVEQCWSIVTSVNFVTIQVYIRDCTMVNMYPLLLFGGGSISVDLEKGNFVLTIDDGWIRFLADSTKVYFCCCFSLTTCKWMLFFFFISNNLPNNKLDLCCLWITVFVWF